MRKEIVFTGEDSIAVVAPHPDDESLGAAAALLLAAGQTDIFVLTDGSHGSGERSVQEEAAVRRAQFEAEMEHLRPRAWHWLGIEDTRLAERGDAVGRIDFTPYTKIFLPWERSFHPDHVAAARMCIDAIRRQKPGAECWSYEINAPFRSPSHYIDITAIEAQKRRLIRFHADQPAGQEKMTLALNAFRAAQMLDFPQYRYVECYLKIEDCP